MNKYKEIIFNFLYKRVSLGLVEINVHTIILFIYGIILFSFSLFFSVFSIRLSGLFFILLGSFFYGIIGGIVTFLWFLLIVITSHIFYEAIPDVLRLVNVLGKYFLMAVAIGKAVDIFRRQQEKLEKSKKLLERTQNLARVGGWEYEVEEDKMYWTEELFNLHGFSRDEGIDYIEKSLGCYPAKTQKKVKAAFEKAVEQGEAYDLEVPFINAEGEKLWIRTIGKPIIEDGKVVKVVGNFVDITERKQTELKLKERVKELDCLYSMLKLTTDPEKPLTQILQEAIEQIPASWQYPDLACARIVFKGQEFMTRNFQPTPYKLAADIIASGERKGVIEVCYFDREPCQDEVGFLPEEQELIEAIAVHLGTIIEQKKMEKELHLTKFSVDKAALSIFQVTPEGKFIYVNERGCRKLGYSEKELIGRRISDVVPTYSQERHRKHWEELKKEGSLVFETRHQTKGEGVIPVLVTTHYLKFQGQEYEFAFIQDITEQKEREEKLKYLSYYDHLTNLHNRRFLEEEINWLNTEEKLPVSLIMADINGLRLINDTYGHEKGDEILIKTAELLTNSVRKEDIVTRWAGDTFVILLPNTTEEETEKVYTKIKEQFIDPEEEIPVSLGMGMAVKEEFGQDIYYILNEAEENMHQDKLTERRSIKSNLVKSLINTLVAKSQETKEHTLRMVDYALELGKRIGLSTPKLNDLSLVAMLHDIGKTSVPEGILKKPGKLTKAEWQEIKKHPQYGYNIASATEEISHVAEEIKSHHEWWDGSGYPRGLKGEEIPILARIVSIVDAYDVMRNERPYKEKHAKEYAVKELKEGAGSQFDPDLVKEFLEII